MPNSLLLVAGSNGVQSNIEMFESLSITNGTRSPTTTDRRTTCPIIEIRDSEGDTSPPLIVPTSTNSVKPETKPSAVNNADALNSAPLNIVSRSPRPDSAVFLRRTYLEQQVLPSLPDDAREILRSQPSIEDIAAVLAYLQHGIDTRHDFNIKVTSAKSSLLIQVLIDTTIPDIWPTLDHENLSPLEAQIRATLLQSLASVGGLEAILGRLSRLSNRSQPSNTIPLKTMLEFLRIMLQGSKIVSQLLNDMTTLYSTESDQRLFWQNIVSLFAGSKLLTGVARAHSSLHLEDSTNRIESSTWLADGTKYSKWLSGNIACTAVNLPLHDNRSWVCLSQLTKRTLSLGYKEEFVADLYNQFLFGAKAYWPPLHQLMKYMSNRDQRVILDAILNDVTMKYFSNDEVGSMASCEQRTMKAIAGVAALVSNLISCDRALNEYIIEWITVGNPKIAGNVFTRRAMVVLLANTQAKLGQILEQSLAKFGDKFQIQHSSHTKHEQLSQTILLVLGHLKQQSSDFSKQLQISSLVTRAVSNRLASSIPQTRILGMVIAVAVSRCVDAPNKVIDFEVEEMETEYVQDLLNLMNVEDKIGTLEDLFSSSSDYDNVQTMSKKRKLITKTRKTSRERESKNASKIIGIEEMSSSSDDEPDLVPYRKPLHDFEDSDEDPTLVNRSKPTAPIYIIDLVKQLSLPSEKLDTTLLALKTAADLVRRKAGFGTELSDNIYGLATALVNLQDGMSERENQARKLDALVACVVTMPKEMGKYLTSTYFSGDFSLAQRSTLLIALGLGARGLAGFSGGQTRRDPALQHSESDFPSQKLPLHVQERPITHGSTMAASPAPGNGRQESTNATNPVALLTSAATTSIIAPLAQSAAESITRTPEILRISQVTRSSAKLSKKDQPQTRRINKELYYTLSDHLFIPLISPLTALLSYSGLSNLKTQGLLHPSTLTLHVQTLTLLLHTIGPVGLSIPSTYSTVTHETLLCLTGVSINQKISTDPPILTAVLGLFLALINITVEIGVSAQERLVGEFGEMTSELVRWVASLEEGRIPAMPDEGTGAMPWPVLAAGVQVRWHEIGKRFQGRFLGFSLDEF